MSQLPENDFIFIRQLAVCTGDIVGGKISESLAEWCVSALAIDGRWGDEEQIRAGLGKIPPSSQWAYLSTRLTDAALISLSDKLLEKYNKEEPIEVLTRLALQGIGDPTLTSTLKRFLELKIFELNNP